MVGRVPESLRAGLRDVVIAAAARDGARLVRGLKGMDVLLPTADLDLIERATMQAFERFGGLSMDELRDIDPNEMMQFGLQFRDLLVNLPFQLPENLLMLGRCIGILSGLCTGLDPDFNIWAKITPYVAKMLSDEGGSTARTVITEAGALARVAIGLPKRADRVLTMAERGELSVSTPRLDLRVRRLERQLARTNGVLMFAGLLIGGAVFAGSDPFWGRALMIASALPLLWALFAGRRRHPGGF